MRSRYLLTFGLLPLWVAIILIVAGLITLRDEATIHLGWILFAAIPACGATLLIVAIAEAVYRKADGTERTKANKAKAFIAVTLIGIAVWLGVVWKRDFDKRGEQTQKILEEFSQVELFIRSSNELRIAVGDPEEVVATLPGSRSMNELPKEYAVTVRGKQTIYVVVSVNRVTGDPAYRVACWSFNRNEGQMRNGSCRE